MKKWQKLSFSYQQICTVCSSELLISVSELSRSWLVTVPVHAGFCKNFIGRFSHSEAHVEITPFHQYSFLN